MRPARESKRNFERLKELLREMFQLDRGDLDFGLYRIMHMKSDEIERFLDKDLLPQVKTVLAGVTDEQRSALEAELERSIKSARKLGVDPESAPAIARLREEVTQAMADVQAEADVYSHLANFFARYYSEGDFLSLRRYSSGDQPTYLIPYDGEEVKLHWANADQYYVKTTENYATYAFIADEGATKLRVRFETAAADSERDNIKEANGRQRRFLLSEDAVGVKDGDLVARFEYRPLTEREKREWPGNGTKQQDRINADTASRILEVAAEILSPEQLAALAVPAPTAADPDRTLLAKHVGRYTAKNSFDYFIHKDLGGFLRRELDLYLKTDVLDLQDLALGDSDRLRRALARMRTVRAVGDKLITFLAQLEDFQKRLWLKKKFVLETQWCVTLDRVPELFYPDIAANDAQWAEWTDYFDIDRSSPRNTGFLKANPYLMLDTRHFESDFKDRLLAALSSIGPLEDNTSGLLVHGENFQALNLLRPRYGGQIQCIYIDPPYNSPSSEILYKNSFKHSSWISLMENRLRASVPLRTLEGVLVVAIDEHERENLGSILPIVYSDDRIFMISVVHNKKGTQGDLRSVNNEHAYFVVPQERRFLNRLTIPPSDWEYSNLRNWGGESLRSDARNCFYPIYVRNGHVEGFGQVCDDDFHPESSNVNIGQDIIAVYPIDMNGVERKWRYARDSVEKIQDILTPKANCRSGLVEIHKPQTDAQIKTVWDDKRYIAGDFGTKLLTDMGLGCKFDYPKSLYTVADVLRVISDSDSCVLDYFAGSGTTGHAVIALNREDGGKRSYILVEMGRHFDTVVLPRLKKAAFAPDWKNGRPVSRDKGISQLIRYVRLESYEDTLDGLVATPPTDELLAENNPAMAEDYRIRYALSAETADSPCLLGGTFRDPFSYMLSVVRDGARRETPADLPETFNLLLGLRVESRRRINDVLVIAGKDPQSRHCLVLWRNLDAVNNEGLNLWFEGHRTNFPDKLDLIFVNGDHTLNAVRSKDESWEAAVIEPLFRELMFRADE